jgi:hypothetical protein
MADELNFQLPPQGFDSYLAGIIPEDQAVLAGAFSVAMQQIRNIERVPAPEFARVVYNSETTIDLPLVNGTDVPTNLEQQAVAKTKEALGSGVNGTYTMSNFFGAMSGLPYPWKLLYQSIKDLQTQKLINIYQEMFLGTTWEYAEVRITQPYGATTTPSFEGSTAQEYIPPGSPINNTPTTPGSEKPYYNPVTDEETYSPTRWGSGGQPAIWDWYYNIGRIDLTEDGGGYGRGSASPPNTPIAIRLGRSGRSTPDTVLNQNCGSSGLNGYCSPTGARVTVNQGTDPQNCASVERKTYGRISVRTSSLGASYFWRTGDSQATLNWANLYGQDTEGNPPRTPILYDGYPGLGGGGPTPRDFAFVQANIPRETIEIQDPPIEMLPVQANGNKATDGANVDGRVFADPYIFPGLTNTTTSSTSLTVSLGAQSLIVEGNLGFQTNDSITLTSGDVFMSGTITSYNPSTGALNVNVTEIDGSGTYDDWQITVAGPGIPIYDAAPGLQAAGTTFWPDPGNAVVQGYIDQANEEIQAIKVRNNENFQKSAQLNALWDSTGIALKHEQRARYIALAPVPIPWDSRYADIPGAFNTFVDSIPEYAQQTAPHMASQTLEHISDNSVGGQSIIAMMRQERNQNRLAEVGIQLDNNMPVRLPPQVEQRLMLNGTLPGAVEGIPSGVIPGIGLPPPGGGDDAGNIIYTLPSWPEDTSPVTYWDCVNNQLRLITVYANGTVEPILTGEGCPIVNPIVPAGPGPGLEPPPNIFEPNPDDGSDINGTFPPPNINTNLTGTTLKPSTYDVNRAIDKVIECNCDCWID